MTVNEILQQAEDMLAAMGGSEQSGLWKIFWKEIDTFMKYGETYVETLKRLKKYRLCVFYCVCFLNDRYDKKAEFYKQFFGERGYKDGNNKRKAKHTGWRRGTYRQRAH